MNLFNIFGNVKQFLKIEKDNIIETEKLLNKTSKYFSYSSSHIPDKGIILKTEVVKIYYNENVMKKYKEIINELNRARLAIIKDSFTQERKKYLLNDSQKVEEFINNSICPKKIEKSLILESESLLDKYNKLINKKYKVDLTKDRIEKFFEKDSPEVEKIMNEILDNMNTISADYKKFSATLEEDIYKGNDKEDLLKIKAYLAHLCFITFELMKNYEDNIFNSMEDICKKIRKLCSSTNIKDNKYRSLEIKDISFKKR